jgi:hypothetical protein
MSAQVREWFQKNKSNYATWHEAARACAKKFGIPRRKMIGMVRGVFPQAAAPKSPRKDKKTGISRAAFLSTHDNDTRIREAVRKAIAAFDGDTILTDAEFRRECGQHTTGWRDVCAEQEFAAFQFSVGGKVFWSDRDTVKWALKEMPHKANGV